MSPAPDANHPALRMTDVRKVYRRGDADVTALDRVSLRVAADEVVALVGPSGSGKTTLCSIAGGILPATGGKVVVGGHDISGYRGRQLTTFRRDTIGFVFQAVHLVPFLTARENLLAVTGTGWRSRGPSRQRADQLLDELGVGAAADRFPGDISGGERQRVAIGRALMNEPRLVLFDEPTSALDGAIGEQVMALIHSEMTRRGIAAIVVTHDERMLQFADRVVHMIDGRLRAGVRR